MSTYFSIQVLGIIKDATTGQTIPSGSSQGILSWGGYWYNFTSIYYGCFGNASKPVSCWSSNSSTQSYKPPVIFNNSTSGVSWFNMTTGSTFNSSHRYVLQLQFYDDVDFEVGGLKHASVP